MENYDVTVNLSVEADSQIEAFDLVKGLFDQSTVEVQLSQEVSNELFAELGVKYD